MLDVVYIFCHSRANDLEIRYSLRSLHRYLRCVRKVWIFGDRPSFLSGDTALVEHVPHEYVSRIGNFRLPVTNSFLLLFLSSLIPELTPGYLWFCDDYVLLDNLSEQDACKTRYLQDLTQVTDRGTGLWKDALWRTYGLLTRLGYTGWNFEVHAPTFLTKKRVLEAYCEFRDFVTEDRFFGLLSSTAILNHAYKQERMELTSLSGEGRGIGFHEKPPEYDEVLEKCDGKTFLNFDDAAFGDGLKRYLAERFPNPSIYERKDDACAPVPAAFGHRVASPQSLEDVFGRIYRSNAWRCKESVSGKGSTEEATVAVRAWLVRCCRDRRIGCMVDLGCGDWNWMRLVMPQVDLQWYRGYDVVPELVQQNRERYGSLRVHFETADVTETTSPKADLVLCRDCLGHLSYQHILQVLAAVKKSGGRYFAATTFPSMVNREIPDGHWRPVNLRAEPFCLPEPEESVVEGSWNEYGEKRMALFDVGLWPETGIASPA